MASQLYNTSLFLKSSIKPQYLGRLVNSSQCKNSRINMSTLFAVSSCATISNRASKELEDSTVQLMANSATELTQEYDIFPIVNKRIEELKEATRECLMTSSDPTATMKLIDTIQRLGVGYHFEQEINEILEKFTQCLPDDNLYTVALRFRLQRHNGHHTNPDVFLKFMDANGKFKKSSSEDIEGLLSLYEASYLGANGEDVLTHAKEYTTTHLNSSISQISPKLGKKVLRSLEIPRHMRMERLEARRYIEEYSNEDDHNRIVLELAKLDYNHVQTLFERELIEITRWWNQLGLVRNGSFIRDRHVECFLWSVGLLPEPKYSGSRIVLAKTIAIMLVIDDIYDTYGSYDELVFFTRAIQRWDLSEMEQLPEYMKICFMALYNTNNDICDKILKERGLSVQPFLRKTWIDMVEAYMVEVEWVKNGTIPNLKDYIKNGVITSGTCMALLHLFFLISEGVTNENMQKICDPYPKVFTMAGTILRLWDDLGTSKEEQERGDVLSTIPLLMKERNITCEKVGRNQILQLIHGLWKDLNVELIKPDAVLFQIIRVALNTSRASQVVYQHNEDSYLSSVENQVQTLFFKPIEM